MGYLVKAGIGLALFFGGIVLFNVKLLQLLDVGTCASGNVPYDIAPGYECPEGTGTDILLLTASIFIGLIGGAIFAFRGDPPWGKRRRSFGMFGLGTLAWGLFFAGTGATMLYAGLSDDSLGADSELGAKIVGITFLVMGLPALALGLWSGIRGLTGRDEGPATATAGMGPLGGMLSRMTSGGGQTRAAGSGGARRSSSSGDSIGKLERLQKLKESGAINQSEFEREKAKILSQD